MKGAFYQPDQREVTPEGVAHLMSVFFGAHPPHSAKAAVKAAPLPIRRPPPAASDDAVKCDEELLNVFGKDAEPPEA